MEGPNLIETANDRVSIISAFSMIGMDLADFSISSLKIYCPFGELYHFDEGRTKAMRVYPGTNSAWCFAGCGYFSPVKLIATDRGIPELQAAEILLESTHYVAPDFASQWDALVNTPPPVNTSDLTEALKTACARMAPNWEDLQFEPRIGRKLNQCLGLLRKVKTDEQATKWLSVSKQAMEAEIGQQ